MYLSQIHIERGREQGKGERLSARRCAVSRRSGGSASARFSLSLFLRSLFARISHFFHKQLFCMHISYEFLIVLSCERGQRSSGVCVNVWVWVCVSECTHYKCKCKIHVCAKWNYAKCVFNALLATKSAKSKEKRERQTKRKREREAKREEQAEAQKLAGKPTSVPRSHLHVASGKGAQEMDPSR